MSKFKIGDWVYASDWCYGQIVELTDTDVAYVEFQTYGGGGCTSFDIEELYHADPPKPHREVELVDIDKIVDAIFEIMNAYDRGVWEDIEYADLAEVWVDALNSDGFNADYSDDILKNALKQFILTKCK